MKKYKNGLIDFITIFLITLFIIVILNYLFILKEERENEQDELNRIQCLRYGGTEYHFWNDSCIKVIQERIEKEIDYKIILPME